MMITLDPSRWKEPVACGTDYPRFGPCGVCGKPVWKKVPNQKHEECTLAGRRRLEREKRNSGIHPA